jgi:uncharacterized protein
MIPRLAAHRLARLLRGFPVVTVTGPRQSGKTTLVRGLLADRPYVNLESSRQREFAQSSPLEFLGQFPDGAVIDEVQNAPALFSEIQALVDEKQRMGMFVLTGSQNLSLMRGISQSMAGRTALVELLPLSIAELRAAGLLPSRYAQLLVQGFFPAVYARELKAADWLGAYLATYAERDARQLSAIQDLNAFQRFLALVAARTAQLLNMQSLASDAGISDKTAKAWLTILETCYLIHFLRPHHANFGKRLVKTPKVYMTDVGLVCALLGIQTAEQAHNHPLRGALFETMVVNDLLKTRWNAGEREPMHFWRDNVGTEVDVLMERGSQTAAVEIKSGIAVTADAYKNLEKLHHYAQRTGASPPQFRGLVYGGDDRFTRQETDTLPWHML